MSSPVHDKSVRSSSYRLPPGTTVPAGGTRTTTTKAAPKLTPKPVYVPFAQIQSCQTIGKPLPVCLNKDQENALENLCEFLPKNSSFPDVICRVRVKPNSLGRAMLA